MAPPFLGVPPRRPPPASPTAVGLAADRLPPRPAAAPHSGPPLHYRSGSCPCARAPPDATPAPRHCWSAPPRPPGQRSTAPPPICATLDTAPPLCGPGSLAHDGATAPTALGAGSAAGVTRGCRTPPP